MRGFGRFTIRAVQSQPAQTCAGIAMTALGINYQEWLVQFLKTPPWYVANHVVQLGVIIIGLLILAYVFWHQVEMERGDHERSDIPIADAYKQILNLSKRSKELVRRQKELLNVPVRYESHLTAAGAIEERLKRRLREEIHDALRQGHLKAWGATGDGSPERKIDPVEWSEYEIGLEDNDIYASPWPLGGTIQIASYKRKNRGSGSVIGHVNIRLCRSNLYREFPLAWWPRRVDWVPLRREILREPNTETV
jgi:hypothetical protein